LIENHELEEYIKKCYLEILGREADESGLNYWLSKIKEGKVNENKFPAILKESKKNITGFKGKLTTNQWMKQAWDFRTEGGAEGVVRKFSKGKESMEYYWKSGETKTEKILEQNSDNFSLILNGMQPKEMKVLEIGCGIGRILIYMSKIFGEVVGVDISSEMLKICRNYTKNISNCTLYENNGLDLSILKDNYFDFCYSYEVFQHIPSKDVVKNYFKEVSRVLKPGKIFRCNVRGSPHKTSDEVDSTVFGVSFTREEIHDLARTNHFEIWEEEGPGSQYYWLTLKSKKEKLD